MRQYAHPTAAPIPNRKRCKIRHSPKWPARCRLPRGHGADHRFGWWRTGAQAINLDAARPELRDGTEP
jgi:hypothetical protein